MSNKFKVGDKVVRTGCNYHDIIVGDVGLVDYIGIGHIKLSGHDTAYSGENFKLVEETSKHHLHHDTIIAWAKGAEIQHQLKGDTEWVSIYNPMWHSFTEYRIKPTKTPQQVEFEILEQEMKSISERMTALKAEM